MVGNWSVSITGPSLKCSVFLWVGEVKQASPAPPKFYLCVDACRASGTGPFPDRDHSPPELKDAIVAAPKGHPGDLPSATVIHNIPDVNIPDVIRDGILPSAFQAGHGATTVPKTPRIRHFPRSTIRPSVHRLPSILFYPFFTVDCPNCCGCKHVHPRPRGRPKVRPSEHKAV